MPSHVDQRRLRDGAKAMALKEPKTLKEMEEQLAIIHNGALALQSMDDLGFPEANQEAWNDMLELWKRGVALEKKIKEIKSKENKVVKSESKEHDVRVDYVNLNNRARLTCYSEGCNWATRVRQSYMTFDEWEETATGFLGDHPCSDIKDEGFRG